jgi:tripartite-type tricarboxylate transporter receptor subunit TctC
LIFEVIVLSHQKEADMASARNKFARLMGIAFTAITIPQFASAVDYPTRQVRWLVPMAAGDMPDILARLMGQWLSEWLGQPFVIDNRPGAATNIGTEAAVRAPADGYTVVLLGPPAAINATLYDRLTFNVLRDIAPVAGIARAPNVMEVGLAVPVKTVPEFIAYARPIRAGSTWLRRASDRRSICRASYSR